jgi:hypothetical protein
LLEHTRYPAYIFPTGATLDRGFAAWAAAHNLPHTDYLRVASGDYVVYYHAGAGG